MTIASEITRLNNAKSDIKTAIENKWVTVPSTDKIDCYASCIDSIQSWNNTPFVDLLVVWGWWGWWGTYGSSWWWWWWGGWVIEKTKYILENNLFEIEVWEGWEWWWYKCHCGGRFRWWFNWWDSCFWDLIAYWGWWWWGMSCCCPTFCCWRKWWSWWWNMPYANWKQFASWWMNFAWQWYPWWGSICCCCSNHWAWGGGAWWPWMPASHDICWNGCSINCSSTISPWSWWLPIQSSISWVSSYYWWGWWWGWAYWTAACPWCWGWMEVDTWAWNWWTQRTNGCNWTAGTWWWGWGAWCSYTSSGNCILCWWNWWSWIVILRYKTDWSYWIDPNCAFGWCKYTCWDYTIHCFNTVWYHNFKTDWCYINTPWIYHNPSCWLITLSTDWVNWTTIKDKNIWATSTDLNNCNSYWCTFAWGNNYWFWGNESSINSQIDASTYWPNNYYCCNKWRYWYDDWSSVRNNNLWWYNTWTKEAMRWPSAEWFHVPTCTEFIDLSCALKCINGWNISANAFKAYLLMPTTQWYSRYNSTPGRVCTGSDWWYWTSTPRTSTWGECNARYARPICIDAWCVPMWNWGRAVWYSIREFKNTPEIPTVWWWKKIK